MAMPPYAGVASATRAPPPDASPLGATAFNVGMISADAFKQTQDEKMADHYQSVYETKSDSVQREANVSKGHLSNLEKKTSKGSSTTALDITSIIHNSAAPIPRPGDRRE